jgi:UDP-N-acetylglucosamine 2-epimerase (non-hydrolysing)
MAPLVKELQKYPDKFDTRVCVTGQHRQMLDQVLEVFDIQPDFDLNVMTPNQDLYDITSKVLLYMRDVLNLVKPDIVFVHGDTTTSLIAGLAAFYQHIHVAHIEAGLRTYNVDAPWPEEINRQLTDRLCEYCFAPTEASKNNLLQEKIGAHIVVTGNTVIDALLMAVDIIKTKPGLELRIVRELKQQSFSMCNVGGMGEGRSIQHPNYILVTGHRRENFGEKFIHICNALKDIALRHPELNIVYPVHLNPNVQQPVYEILSGIENIYLIAPLNYLPFVYMMQHCYLVLTDSGGVQEEAPSLGKPVLVMRDTTERSEAIEAGTARLVGTTASMIVEQVEVLLNDKAVYQKMAQAHNPYGDGKACERIVMQLERILWKVS